MKAICPGSFDPVTFGHLDIIRRSSRIVDEVIIGVGRNTSKSGLFTPEERVEMLEEATADIPGVRPQLIDGLLVDFCMAHDIGVIVKGLRFAADFDYELQMAQMNRQLQPVETVLLPTSAQWAYVSSTLVREVAHLGGDVSEFVPQVVVDQLRGRQKR